MLCPECFANHLTTKLRVEDSRAAGPFEQQRKYVCPHCGFTQYNIERLAADQGQVENLGCVKN